MRHWKTAAACLALGASVLLTAGPALAQTTVDMRPLADSALEWIAALATTVLTVLGSFGIRYVSSATGLANSQLEASLNARLVDGIHAAIGFALTAAQNEVNKPGSTIAAVSFNNWFLSLAASYVNGHFPEIIAQFSLTDDKIKAMIMARLQPYLAAIPVTGAATQPAIVTAATAAIAAPTAS